MDIKTLFNRLKPYISNSTAISSLVILLVVWFVTPHIAIHGSYPFASHSARVLLLALLALTWLGKLALNQFKAHGSATLTVMQQKLIHAWVASKQALIRAWYYCRNRAQFAKENIKHDKHRRDIHKKPWYLVIGSQQSGKKSLLANLGLYFTKPDHYGQAAVNYTQQFPDYDWWFSEQAVFIDAMTYSKDDDLSNWRRFVKLLRRERSHKPLNGIVITLSQADLMRYSNQQRQELIQELSYYIRDLHQHFKSQVPVYLMLTKSDLVDGFLEYFNDLNKEEVNQLFGMSIPLTQCGDFEQVKSYFNQEYTSLIKRLRQRVLWILDSDRTLSGRELIHAYPQQMQLLKIPMEHFITELFAAVRYQNVLQLRGIYMVSSLQQGTPIDFLYQVMSRKFSLIAPNKQRTQRLRECFFVRRIFFDVMQPEALALGNSERSIRRRQLSFASFKLAMPSLLIAGSICMYNGYQNNLSSLNSIGNYIDTYQALDANLQNDASLSSILPMLDSLNSANKLFNQDMSFSQATLYQSHVISHSINNALNRNLQAKFLPRIAALVEKQLNSNISDQNLLYATLKAYLSFSASEYTKPIAIKAPMEYTWNKQFLHQQNINDKLKYYLDLALQQPIDKLPLDRQLINRRRSELEAIIPADRAYGLLTLRSTVADLPNLNLVTAIGSNFNKIFSTNNKDRLVIPVLYSQQGYHRIFLKEFNPIAHEVAEDNHDIGLIRNTDVRDVHASSDYIAKSISQRYNHTYIQQWQQHLANIHVKSFDNIDDAINKLTLLTQDDSPLVRLLNIIYDNSHELSHENINIDQHFIEINQYATNQNKQANWRKTEQDLTRVRDYLKNLRQSANYDLASFNAAKDAIAGKDNPIQALSVDAKLAPKPMQTWLSEIANASWTIIIQGAHQQINNAWQKDVMDYYNSNIAGRYPLNPSSHSQLAMEDFDNFYGVKGRLDKFFKHYLSPFINMQSTPWKLLSINGHDIAISKDRIALGERAQSIRQQYFSSDTKTAKLHFTIQPLTLDSRVISSHINFGPYAINYSHGPRHSFDINWPLTSNNNASNFILNGFSNINIAHNYDGPWSLFKILQLGHLTPANKNGRYIFSLNLHGYQASYTIDASSDIHTLRLDGLKHFSLPEAIAKQQRIHQMGEAS